MTDVGMAPAQDLDFATFWGRLAQRVLKKLRERAHVNITIVIADGRIQRVREEGSYLPVNIPPM